MQILLEFLRTTTSHTPTAKEKKKRELRTMTSNGKEEEEEVDVSKRFHLDKLTSDVFGVTNPPKELG